MHISSCTCLQIATFKNDTSRLFLLICFLPDIFCVTFLNLLSLNFTFRCTQFWYPVSLVPTNLFPLSCRHYEPQARSWAKRYWKKYWVQNHLNCKNPLRAINILKKIQYIYVILVCMHAIKYMFILKLQFMFIVRF